MLVLRVERMSKTKIEWCDLSINPVKGLCPVACDYCYARRMYRRFKWNPEIRFDWSVANDLPKIKKPSRIFWGSTMELFGKWVDPEWLRLIFEAVKRYSQHTHIFLTKKPENLPQEWPVNCWVGVSAPTQWSFDEAVERLARVHASVKFLSFEPLCDRISIRPTQLIGAGVNWVILGRETPIRKREYLPWQWFKEVVEAADSAGTPVFLKDNLSSLLPAAEPFYKFIRPTPGATAKGYLRQEFPA
jgi:protein gp37